eukprot:143490-Hanusia_phi.AAC.3
MSRLAWRTHVPLQFHMADKPIRCCAGEVRTTGRAVPRRQRAGRLLDAEIDSAVVSLVAEACNAGETINMVGSA